MERETLRLQKIYEIRISIFPYFVFSLASDDLRCSSDRPGNLVVEYQKFSRMVSSLNSSASFRVDS